MVASQPIQRAARILRDGGIVAYPTEGVFGLGCLPDNLAAVSRILQMKERSPTMGLALIAADPAQLGHWTAIPENSGPLNSSDENPVTWVVPATANVPAWIRGQHAGVAVRLTTHPIAHALCVATGSAIVSTSANVSGRPPARNAFVLRRCFGALVDYIVPGQCGPASGPSEIRELQSGKILRPA